MASLAIGRTVGAFGGEATVAVYSSPFHSSRAPCPSQETFVSFRSDAGRILEIYRFVRDKPSINRTLVCCMADRQRGVSTISFVSPPLTVTRCMMAPPSVR